MPTLDSVLADGGLPATVRHAAATFAPGEATTAQSLAIPRLGEARSVLLSAPTGSGKTLVAAVAVARDLAGGASAPAAPRALVLCPTRELAEQVSDVLAAVLEGIGARTVVFTGRPAQRRDALALARPVDCLVATPGRLLDMIRTKQISLGALRRIVLDEADLLLGVQFAGQTEAIVNAVPRPARGSVAVLAMSATTSTDTAEELERRFGTPPLLLDADAGRPSPQGPGASGGSSTGPGPAAAGRAESAGSANGDPGGVSSAAPGPPRRLELLVADGFAPTAAAVATLCARARSAMVFVPRREDVAGLLEHLRDKGFAAEGYTGRSSPAVRAAAMDALRGGRATVLVCTDVAARGIDIDSLALVVHVGVPHSAAELTHRSGRTGRGHRAAGLVAAIVPTRDRDRILGMAAAVGIEARPRSARELAEDLGSSDVRNAVSPARSPRSPREPGAAREPGERRTGGRDGARNDTGRREPEWRRAKKAERPIARGRKDEREAQRARGRRPRRGR